MHQNHEELTDKSLQMEAKFGLEKTTQPMVDAVPEVMHIPNLVELIRRCTIPQRATRIQHTSTVVNSLHRIAKELDVPLTDPA